MLKNKVVFMGTPAYAARILQELIDEKFELLAIFTQADKAFGRKQILKASEVKTLALQKLPQVPIFSPKSLKDSNIFKELSDLKPDFIVVAAYGKILPKEILDLAICINLHASLLPKYRGASPIQSAILNADEVSGVCTMLMQEGLDNGPVLESKELFIKDKKASEVFDEMAELAAKLCVQTLKNYDNIKPQIQDETKMSVCKKIQKENGLVYLKDAKKIYQKFLAFYPWPGIFLQNGLKFIDLEFIDEKEHENKGEILALENDGFLLACEKGTLKIKKLQESGKKVLEARTYLNGKRLSCGNNLY